MSYTQVVLHENKDLYKVKVNVKVLNCKEKGEARREEQYKNYNVRKKVGHMVTINFLFLTSLHYQTAEDLTSHMRIYLVSIKFLERYEI